MPVCDMPGEQEGAEGDMKGFCFWCGASLDHHDETNPAYVAYGEHEAMPTGEQPMSVRPDCERVPVVCKGETLPVELL